jgi:peroxiredoxin
MRILASLLALGAVVMAASAPPMIRQTPDFTVAEPSGKQIPLSSLKGKVVVIAFMYTTCPHCQDEARMLTKLTRELGPRGLQVLGVAFNDNAAILVPGFVQQFAIGFPVGASDRPAVLNYLGLSEMTRWSVPQVVVIDRKGNIRAQSPAQGDPNLQMETYMRDLLDTLLKEPTASAKKASTTHQQ